MTMNGLKCLFVDWHNTLSTSLFWGHLRNPAHPHHHLFKPITSNLFLNPDAYRLLLEPWMRGDLTSEDVVSAICRETELDPIIVLRELIVSCQNIRLVSQEVPGYIASIRAQGVKVVIATDNMDTFMRWTVPSLHLWDLFDDILSSSEVKSLKSDINQDGISTFFASYLRDHHIDRGESLLLDDGEEDFGHIIQQFGIEYRHIEPGLGLVPALQALITSFS